MPRYLTIPKFSTLSGYTEDAIRSKIRDGIWSKDRVWLKAPDNRILIDVKGYELWVENGGVLRPYQKAQSKSPLPTKGLDVEKGFNLSPMPLI